ncbi:Rep family protein [Secundilactobacillus pentosiphilus]|nr:Rep family protein [Secundilactobacillus pentosiphilus]
MKVKKTKHDHPSNYLRSAVLMYEQQLEHLPFKNIEALERRIKSLLDSQGLDRYALIVHDQDKDENDEIIKPHVHVTLIFNERVSINAIAKVLDESPQQFEVMTKRGNSAKVGAENALMYLIHRTSKSTNKHQYSVSAVRANFDFATFVSRQEQQVSSKDILDLLGDGKVSEIQAKQMMMAKGANVFANYSRKIKDVAAARLEIEYERWLVDMKQSKKQIKVIWIYGESGTGKTRYTIDFAIRHHKSYFKTSGSNDPFEGYAGEKVLIIDELRPETLRFQDLLQILDPHVYEKKTVARYHNAHIMAEVIFITSPYDPLRFYNSMYGISNRIDNFQQLNRRIGLILNFQYRFILEQICEVADMDGSLGYVTIQTNRNQYSGKQISNGFSMDELEEINNESSGDVNDSQGEQSNDM